MHDIILVAKREYTKVIRKWTFWVSTLLLPALIAVLALISALSTSSVENNIMNASNDVTNVLIIDQTGIFKKSEIKPPFTLLDNDDIELAKKQVMNKEADVLIVYAKDLLTTKEIETYSQYLGLITSTRFQPLAINLLKQAIYSELDNNELTQLLQADLSVKSTEYDDIGEVSMRFERFIVPMVSVGLYFMLVMFASSYLLLSVSEEKENRMIEIVISSIKSRELIWGKILGQIAIVFTQLLVLISLAVLALIIFRPTLPFDLSLVDISIGQVIGGIFYLVTGFLIMASIMVGVGAAVPTYKDAQSFSSIFIILSILPIYFATMILAEPSGSVAMIASYFPLTSPMILLFRNSLGELSLIESVLSTVIVILYVYVCFWLAVKLFEFGSLEYNNRISLRTLVRYIYSGK